MKSLETLQLTHFAHDFHHVRLHFPTYTLGDHTAPDVIYRNPAAHMIRCDAMTPFLRRNGFKYGVQFYAFHARKIVLNSNEKLSKFFKNT